MIHNVRFKSALLKMCVLTFAFALSLPLFTYSAPVYADTIIEEAFSPAIKPDSSQPLEKHLIVIMYHKILKSKKGKYIVTPATLEDDLKELKARGYETVFPSEVIAFAEGRGGLPAKPVLITFDDGCYNNHYYGTPIFKKHGCKGILNVVGAFSAFSTESGDHSKPQYSHLTWQQIRQIAEDGVFEIGNHTYNMHKFEPRYGIKQTSGESDSAYKKALTDDVMKLQNIFEKQCGIKAECFAYPFGCFSQKSNKILIDLGFKMLFICTEKPNILTYGKPDCLHSVCRYNRDGNVSRKSFFDRIEKDVKISLKNKKQAS